MQTTLNFDGYMEQSLKQGVSFEKILTMRDSNGNPVNLTGYTAKMKIKRSTKSETIYELNTTNNRIQLGGTSGNITLTLTAAETASVPFGRYIYDLILTDSLGKTYEFATGQIFIFDNIS